MAVADVWNLEGKTVGQVELADSVFASPVNAHLLHEAVRWYLAGQRAGTHKTKGRGEVSGAGRKLWKQKGTGRARVGSIRSSIWRKGGTVHGPQPRSYEYALPKKMVVGALRSALSAKFADEKLTVVEEWALESHKTKAFRQALGRLDKNISTVLVVQASGNHALDLASRNLEGVKVVTPAALQAYDLLRHDRVMLSKDTAIGLGRTLGRGIGDSSADTVETTPTDQGPTETPKPKRAKAASPAKSQPRKPAAKAKTAERRMAKP